MHKILIVTEDKKRLSALSKGLEGRSRVEVSWVDTGKAALEAASTRALDLIVIDEELPDVHGLELIRQLTRVNALVNTAIVSDLPPDEFHELSEGLGIMAQLSSRPGREEGESLLTRLEELRS